MCQVFITEISGLKGRLAAQDLELVQVRQELSKVQRVTRAMREELEGMSIGEGVDRRQYTLPQGYTLVPEL